MRCQRHISLVVALASALMLGGATSIFAQQPSEFQPTQLPGWSFTPGVIASAVYDDNIALAAEVPTRPNATGDQLLLIEPYGQLEFNGPRTTFDSGYRGSVRRYFDLDELNGYDQRAYASLRHRATRHVTVFLTNRFSKVPATDELELSGVQFARTGSRSNTLAGGFDSRLTRHMDWNVRYDLTWVAFDHTTAQLTNGLFHGVRTGLARRLSDRSSVGGEYAIRFANLDEGARNFMFQDMGVTFHYDTGPRTSISAATGFSYLIDKSLDDNRTGPYVRAGITHHVQRATVGATFSRAFVPTFGFGGSSQSESFTAFVGMPVSRNRVYMQQSVTWHRTDPLITTSPALDSFWLHSTVGYAMSRWLRLEGFYSFARQDSSIPGGLIHRQRIGGQVVLSQPMRIR